MPAARDSRRRSPAPTPRRGTASPAGRERLVVALLLAAHVALATWGAVKQSVTFDENFHLPAGVMEAAHGHPRKRVAAGGSLSIELDDRSLHISDTGS
jgi:hypothetical protein